ncbi:adenosylcobinamide-GDP ribazoletransferase [Methanolobus sp. WCC4]|uniref:adenosylcobinamide-GDP ribazoletransferase n=1 Tax=Methanolobus sp. WCC4 TaxID=3125784 RepID=UPI0030F54063
MTGFLLALKSSFGFLSTIPVGITMEGLDEFFKRTYLHQVVGIVLGLMMGAVAYLLISFLPVYISAVLMIAFIYYITGLNHLDGVADLGDGLTAHGSVEKKLKALKDMSLGIGGVAYAALIILALYASLISLYDEASVLYSTTADLARIFFFAMFVSEVSAMQSMLTVAAFGKSIHEGLGSILVNNTTVPKYLIGFVIGSIACVGASMYFGLGISGIFVFLAAIVATFVLLNVSNRHFGGVNGDVIGASNEFGRIIALITVTLVLMYGGIV